MSSFKILTLLITFFFLHNKDSFAQSAEIKNELFKGAGFVLYTGENDAYVYKLVLSDTIQRKKVKLIAVSKENRKIVIGLPLNGFPENEDYYQGLNFHTCIVQDHRVVIFWSKNTGNSEELYLESYDPALHRTQAVQKIYTNSHAYDLVRGVTAKQRSTITVLVNPAQKNELFIGGEIPIENDNVLLEYAILSDDSLIPTLSKVKLPVQLKKKSFGKSCTYQYLENGNLLIRSIYTAEEGKGNLGVFTDGGILLTDVNSYHTVSYLDVNANEIVTIELPVSEASFSEVSIRFLFVGEELRIYGLAINSDNNSHKFTGLFYAGINTNDFSQTSEFIPFEQAVFDSMYEEKSLYPYSIKDIKMKDETILFFMSDGTWYKGAAYLVLEYTVDHELLRFGSERDF